MKSIAAFLSLILLTSATTLDDPATTSFLPILLQQDVDVETESQEVVQENPIQKMIDGAKFAATGKVSDVFDSLIELIIPEYKDELLTALGKCKKNSPGIVKQI
jgi:hypothetical protein